MARSVLTLLLVASGLATTAGVMAATLQHLNVTLAANPTGVGFYIYVPDRLAVPKPPILVNPHWCHGSATAAHSGTRFAALADRYGFIVIYPDAPRTSSGQRADQCWDVSSAQTLSHDGGGDSLGIVSMVRWTLDHYGADAGRVFAAGVSSGAMMTSTLLGAYPDVFAAGSAWSGVPFGCFAPGSGSYPAAGAANNSGVYDFWNSDCSAGKVAHPPDVWGSMVRQAFPGYGGRWRPKMQLFHGTVDDVLNYEVLGEEVKQWAAVFGYAANATASAAALPPSKSTPDTPLPSWTTSEYGPDGWLHATSAKGVPHNIPVQESVVMDWFELACTESGAASNSTCFRWGKGGPSKLALL